MRIKRRPVSIFLSLMLAAVITVTAFAFGGSETHYKNLPGIGVKMKCQSTATTYSAYGILDLIYLPDPSAHLPENDYSTKVWVYVTDIYGGYYSSEPAAVVGMHNATLEQSREELDWALIKYFVNNGSTVPDYHKSFQ
ncbi:MAG: hypothetical protein J5772_05990 [Clostridia bacterium]|nr:hypothetical protein [Clostridia bacterium]